ncbi:hypothetical protein GCM10010201_01910 [Pilimelia columellifera subsp. columellifera]|uniref:Uncharacterized protein n=1 Tax=Pilimelia columellifera subsp. columellifera TaxID=706583 RepID=A0ABN3MY89_9ACTN
MATGGCAEWGLSEGVVTLGTLPAVKAARAPGGPDGGAQALRPAVSRPSLRRQRSPARIAAAREACPHAVLDPLPAEVVALADI